MSLSVASEFVLTGYGYLMAVVGIRLTEDTAYLPSGYYGVQAFQL